MKKSTKIDFQRRGEITDALTEVLRTGARALLQRAIEAELAEHLEKYKGLKLPDGTCRVVRNGYQPE